MATFSDALRRLYSDLVTRRARVRVVQAAEPSLGCDPVFLIGIYRSGTTLLRYVLDSHSNLACPPESAFLSHLDHMYRDPRSESGFESLGYDSDHVLSRMRSFAAYFLEGYATSQNKKRWVEKAPIYVDHLQFIRKLFPSARMLMLYRHPLDQIDSAVKRNTIQPEELAPFLRSDQEDARLVHARYWANKAEGMLEFEKVEDARTHRMRYEDLCAEPEATLKPVFEFLHEAWEDRVLKFYESDHDKGNEDGRVAATRGFVVSQGNYQAWPQGIRAKAWEIVRPVAEVLSYEAP